MVLELIGDGEKRGQSTLYPFPVIPDLGKGIQVETTVLGIPCLTLRENTERPITVWEGTNKLVGVDDIAYGISEILKENGKKGKIPELWDGKAAERMMSIVADKLISR